MKWMVGIVLLATTVAVLAGAFSTSTQSATDEELLLGLFPEDSRGMIFVDLGELRSIELAGVYLERLDGMIQESPDDFSGLTVLDPLSNVNQVMLGWAGEDEFLGSLRAEYDARDLAQYFEERETPSEVYEGRTIYQPDSESGWSMAFFDGLILIGPRPSIVGALERMGTAAPTALDNPELVASIQSIEPGNQVWGVGRLPGMLIPQSLAPPMAIDLLAALENVTYQMRLDSAMTARAVGQFANTEAADRMGELLSGIIALGKIQLMGDEIFSQLLDGFQIDSIDSAIEINFSVDGELLKQATEVGLPFPLLGDE